MSVACVVQKRIQVLVQVTRCLDHTSRDIWLMHSSSKLHTVTVMGISHSLSMNVGVKITPHKPIELFNLEEI